MTDHCPRCGGLLFVVDTTRTSFIAKCSGCRGVHKLDSDFEVVDEYRLWHVAGVLILVLLFIAAGFAEVIR